MPTDAEGQYQDPLLNPGQLRQFVKNLPGKIKHIHDDYEHRDSNTLEHEIDEFFSYAEAAEVCRDLHSDRQTDLNKQWQEASDKDRRFRAEQLLDQLESTLAESRLEAAKRLVSISLGVFNQAAQARKDVLAVITESNRLLRECGALSSVYRGLRRACSNHDIVNQRSPTADQLDTLNCEIDLYVTLLYLLLETYRQRSEDSTEELETLEPSLPEFLFLVVAQLREKYMKSFPVKKLIILLWKSLLITFGGHEELHNTKRACTRLLDNICSGKKDANAKCSPQDLHSFQKEVTEKYPTYSPPDFPFPVSSPFSVKADSSLASAMGISSATERADLPYQTLFPPKANGQVHIKRPQMPQQPYTLPPHHSLVLPLSHSGPRVPRSIVEAGQIYVSNMHLSRAEHQIIQERENAIHRWQNRETDEQEADDTRNIQDSRVKTLLSDIEHFYAAIVPELQNIVIVLLKLLLSTVTSNTTNNMPSVPERNGDTQGDEDSETLSAAQLEEVDTIRNREVLSKAIASTLFLMLKWLKMSHVLKFEYLSKLLVDSGCLLLILKILGLQEITTLVAARTDIDEFSFFGRRAGEEENVVSAVDDISTPYTSHRNNQFFANFTNAYKTQNASCHAACAVQVIRNMKIISAVYLRCNTVLKDDWISKNDPDDDLEDGMTQEVNLRMLVGIYNGQRYLPHLLPPRDDFSEDLNIGSMSNAEKYATEEIALDPGFLENYEEWLQNEVFNTDDHSSVSSVDDTFSDSAEGKKGERNWDLGTPIPSPTTQPPPISPDLLVQEINKLYQEELSREFKVNTPALSEDDGWESPTPMLSSYLDEGGDCSMEAMSKNDPLKDINWETLTEEELTERLNRVEERTVQRWLSVDIDDPQYQKVLNAVEGLYIDSDTGEGGIAPIPGTEYDL